MTLPATPHRLLALLAGVLLIGGACGADGRYIVLGSARAPSASGVIEADALGGGSTQVSVHLEGLHPPSRLKEELTSYVVWFEPVTGSPIRGGVLRFNAEERTGDLSRTAPFRQFSVKITAEKTAETSAPGDTVIAIQRISLD
jgi:hypothetical protein